jgi:hypothetical protein
VANLKTKIEKLGLDTRVAELMTSGINTSRKIAAALNDELGDDHSISYRAVAEYIRRIKGESISAASEIMQRHVDRVIRTDLETLEDLQAILVRWAKEDPAHLSERLATARAEVQFNIDKWYSMILSAKESDENSDQRKKAVRAIVKEAVEIVLAEDRLQEQRTRAMMAALKIIQTKVDKGALMEGEGRGNIIIVDGDGNVTDGPVAKDGAVMRNPFKMHVVGKVEGDK